MTQLLNKTVAAIVTDNFRTAPVFEKYGIDFCCKGKQSLQSACEEKNINPTNVIQDLELIRTNSSDETRFAAMYISELIDHIVTVHHQYVRANLRPILRYLSKIDLKHGERYPYINEVLSCFSRLSDEMESHMQQEEDILFPLMRNIANNDDMSDSSDLQSLITSMEQEHSTAGELLEKIRTLTGNYNVSDNACTTFRLTMKLLEEFESDMHQHVHLENHILFPKAISAL